MGTCGFVGIIDSYKFSVQSGNMEWWLFLIAVLTIFFILPGIISWSVCTFMRKKNWIKENDLKLNV
ncbi:hypothetical protein EOM82_09725 [bacterium]|nr:hypothetical protein [bacterium]